MERRRLGRTGLEISAFTLGGGAVGGILLRPPEPVRVAALERALAAGCNWVDTAADYGGGESERTLGRLLPGLPTRPHLSTKVRLDLAGPGDLAGQVRRSLEASLERLGTDRVDLFQLHNPIAAETGKGAIALREVLRPGGVADIFDRLRQEGLFAFQGITALGETPALLEAVGSGRFDTAQVYYNMLNPSAGRGLPEGWGGQDFGGLLAACEAHEVGVMAIRVLAAGVLAGGHRHGREDMITAGTVLGQEEDRARRLMVRLGGRYGMPAQTALRFVLGEARLSTIVVGLETLDHLEEALAAFAAGPLPPEAMADLAAEMEAGYRFGPG